MVVKGVFSNAQRSREVPAGAVVFNAGDDASEMYGIISGQIELRTPERIIATLGPDEVFGELALVDHSPRMATATAVTDTVLAVIDQRMFLFLVHETPTFALSVMSTIANRLRALSAAGVSIQGTGRSATWNA
jgi:CRP-like cAMP-binding protein